MDTTIFKKGNIFEDTHGRLYILCKVGYKSMQMIDLFAGEGITHPISVEISYDLTKGEVNRICNNIRMSLYKDSLNFYKELKIGTDD